MSRLPVVSASWSKGKTINEITIYDIRKAPFDYKKEPYFAMISAAYIATYLCGISMEHLSPSRSSNVPNLITSIMRYHLYYTIHKFMTNPKLIDKCNVEVVKNNFPVKMKLMTSVGKRHGYTYPFDGFVEYSDRDYLFFIAS